MSIEGKDEKMTNRSRKIKFFLDKMKAQENQTDSVAKLVKDLIVRKAITWVKAAAPIIGLVLLLLVLVVAMIAVPVIAVIAILYNSPFALFLPPLESGDTVQTVTSAYVQEFNRDVNTKVNEHALGDFAPKFAELNDDVLFGEVWSREDKLPARDRSIVTVTALMASGVLDSSLAFHIGEAKKNGVTKEEMAEILTHAAFYAGWPKAWAAFRMAKEIYQD